MNIPPRNADAEERLGRYALQGNYMPYSRRLMNRNYIGNHALYEHNKHEIRNIQAALKEAGNNKVKSQNLDFLREQLVYNAEIGKQYAQKQKVLRNITGKVTLKKTRRNFLRELQKRALSEGIVSQPVKIMETLDDGDCFYSSIYRAAKERSGLLEHISASLNLPTSFPDEEEFITACRQKVADKLLLDSTESELYTRLKEVSEVDPESYKEMMEQYPAWFVREFGKTGKKLGTKEEFYENMVKHITSRGKWVGQIEVEQAEEMLLSINIRLKILRTIAYELPPREGGMDILWLYNPGEAHYEYFSFHEPSSSGSSLANTPSIQTNATKNTPNPNLFNKFSNSESNTKPIKKKQRRTRRG